ncbi:hypothetical protein [Streptomyces sp. NPDC018833]
MIENLLADPTTGDAVLVLARPRRSTPRRPWPGQAVGAPVE